MGLKSDNSKQSYTEFKSICNRLKPKIWSSKIKTNSMKNHQKVSSLKRYWQKEKIYNEKVQNLRDSLRSL